MKKSIKILFSLILSISLMMGLALTSSAAGLVTYEGEAQDFIFAPGTEYSPTDLFTDFKNVMPGDSISQTVRVVNNGKNRTTTAIYIKALGPSDIADGTVLGNGDDTDGYTDKPVYRSLLDQLHLKVELVGGDKTLFDAPASETDGLSDWVFLGNVRHGAEVDLKVTLEVPIEMGNEFQDVAAALDWSFKVEEYPDSPTSPDTGDNTGIMIYAGVFGLAAMALIVIIILKRKAKEEE